MAEVLIEDIFYYDRFPQGAELLPLLFYFPFGLMLALVRIFIGLQVLLIASVLPKLSNFRRFVLRFMCGVLGILVTQEGHSSITGSNNVYIANYTSVLDHLALYLCHPVCVPCVWKFSYWVSWALGYTNMSIDSGKETFMRKVKEHCEGNNLPICVFPEVATTSGKVGLLKFSTWPFALDQPIRPVVIRVQRPIIARLSPSVLGSSWIMDIFWFLFVPYTHFSLKLLPMVNELDDESPSEFATRVEKLIAKELKVESTSFTSNDKSQLMERIIMEQLTATEQQDTNQPDEMTVMALQVQAVLPHVPLQCIKDDLGLTRDVDLTVTNILEGRVKYENIEIGIEAEPPSPPKAPITKQPTPKITKPKSPRTLEERKNELYETARRRYKEKHGLS